MRHIIIFCLLMLCQLPIWGQARLGDDGIYNPENPGDPQLPVLMHQVTLEASPKNGGSFNMTSERVAEGSSVSLYAYPETGFVFKGWMLGETLLSTERSYTYTMKNQDVKIIGLFEYNPDNVDDPQSPVLMHQLRLEASPKQGGSFNFSSQNVKEGGEIDLSAYPNDGFVFKGWMKGDSLLSEDSYYTYTMGGKDTDITGLFEYNPRNPSNPGQNSWNSATGEVIVDDFEAGGLYSAVNEAIGGYENASQVTMMLVSGKMSTSDLGITNNYSNCTLLDLSRTYGYTEIPSYGFDGTNLQSVILPSCIERIGYNAFYDCQNLSSISCYAVVPPEASSDAFKGIAEGAVLRVLSSSVSLYAEAEGWKDFTILPLSEEVRSLEVSLPADGADGRYKNMTLELLNMQSGQRQRYIISDRLSYTFNGLLKDSEFKVSVLNVSGAVLGQIENITIADEDVSVAFESLLQPQTVSLKLLTDEGGDYASSARVTWTSENGSYLQQGTTVSGVLSGMKVTCRISLPQELGMQYLLPQDTVYIVKETGNELSVVLHPIEKVTIIGKVKDVSVGATLSQASVTISQKLNGLYSKSFTMQTDAKGNFSAEVYNAPTTIVVSATDYVNASLDRNKFDSTTDLGEISLKPISGVTINTNFTYTSSVVQGEEPRVDNWYSDYANVSYRILNQTTGKEITQFSVQYPKIVLLEDVAVGDRLHLTVSSRLNAFRPVEVEGIVNEENRIELTIPIIELGGIHATFAMTENSSVVGILYDYNGQLVKKYNYAKASLSISGLVDGEYTLITMTNSDLFNSILNLSQFSAAGLTEGTDYILNKVTVASGSISSISNESVPVLDESKLYYTADNTLFSVNKTSILAGNYLTLKGQIRFKDMYVNKASNVSMVVDLPESCSFVENSVMVGSKISPYTLDGNRLIVPLESYLDQVRFCVIPVASGEYSLSAFVNFTMDNKIILQPIGNAGYKVKDLSISAPSTVAKTTIPVSGMALSNSRIQIFDNNILIGETESLANGMWNTTCELYRPYNLSTHKIQAKVTTKQGLELQSEVIECFYNSDAIEAKTVTMTFYNGWLNDNVSVVFDFQTGKSSESSYMFYTTTDITFIADLTNNDTTVVSDVVLYVYTDRDEVRKLPCQYDKSTGKWVAISRFSSDNLPINVNLEFLAHSDYKIDGKQLDEAYGQLPNYINDYKSDVDRVNNISAQIEQELSKEDFIDDTVYELLGNYNENDPWHMTEENVDDLMSLDDQAFDSQFNSLMSESEKFLNDATREYESMDSLVCNFSLPASYETIINNQTCLVVCSTCEGLSKEELIAQGYKRIQTTTDDVIYELVSDLVYDKVDFTHNKRETITLQPNQMMRVRSDQLSFDNIKEVIKEKIKEALQEEDDLSKLYSLFNKDMKDKLERIGKLEKTYNKQLMAVDKKLTTAFGLKEIELKLKKKAILDKIQKAEDLKAKVNRLPRNMARINSAIFYLHGWLEWANKVLGYAERLENLNDIPLCVYETSPEGVALLETWVERLAKDYSSYYLKQFGRKVFYDLSGIWLNRLPLLGAALSKLEEEAERIRDEQFGRFFEADLDRYEMYLAQMQEKCDPEDDPDKKNPPLPPFDPVNPIHDPSGYVYEAVSSNRLEGVTATCYYKEVVEDMYGDLHENVVLWNAAEYAQENPLFTDENGMYRWDVPQGLWQVKFEKDGYETTYSEWLPVPPPQLEVNIPMVQNRQPEVIDAHVYEDGIEIQFDKYMQPESMTGENIFVTKNDQDVSGEITLLNAEQAYTDNPATYVSKVRFVPATPFLTTDEIVLTVSRKVKSYAGISMETDFTQSFDVEREVKELVVDSEVSVPYTGTKTIRVSATPFDAAIGKVLTVKSSSPMIVSVDENSFKLDENGQASVVVHGNLPGSAVLSFLIEDVAVSASTTVKVSTDVPMQTATPVASRVSGTAVYRNTAIELSCETENAVIYYTVDGSCPCDENGTRQVYKEPIVVSKDMTIKAMAHVEKYEDSEVAEFTYTIKTATLGLNLHTGWNWISHNLETDVPVAQLQEDAVRIVGQESEVIKDPQLGFEGNLQSLSPLETYKVQAVNDGQNILTGFAFNPATALTLEQGWNWLGYPMNQVMSLDEAFALAELEEEDLLVGQDGFAQYAEGAWTGTLKTLAPGKGYLFCSKSDKKFSYNANIVSKAQSLYAQGIKNESSWTVDKYKYPNIMCLIADLYDQGASVAADAYAVGAFAGTECRGIAQVVDGKLMMNIYGEGGEEITFKAMKYSSEELFSIQETVPFEVTLLGSVKTPYKLNISKTTDISNQEKHWKVYPTLVSSRLYISYDGQEVDKVTLTDAYGTVAVLNRNLKDNESIDISHLPDGVYIVTAVAGNEVYYKKIVKVSR